MFHNCSERNIICLIFFILTSLLVFSPNVLASTSFSQENLNSMNKSETIKRISANDTNLRIYTSFYPLYDFVKKIGKDKVDVSTVVPIGIEPHDFDPTPKQIIDLQKADLVFINGAGFEKWIRKITNPNIVDLSKKISIEKIGANSNPHIWLDPLLVKSMASIIFNNLAALDPKNVVYYQANLNEFDSKLEELDSNIVNNLTNCPSKDFIAFHDAFGYFSKRYGLIQHSINGLSPELDMNPQRVSESIELAEKMGITTIFSEDNIEPRLAQTISEEIGGQVLILSPIEMISQKELDLKKDYFSKMYDNLNNLKIALGCKE